MAKKWWLLVVIFCGMRSEIMAKKVALVIAHKQFQPVEYFGTKDVLEKAGIAVVTASNQVGPAYDGIDNKPTAVDKTVDELNVNDYAGIFLIGGRGAMDHLDNKKVYALMVKARDARLVWGSICISPRILVHADIVRGTVMTGWDDDHKLKPILESAGARLDAKPVVFDRENNLITAQGPKASEAFGQAIVAALQ